MNAERWRQIDELFHAVVECPPGERAKFLESACKGDESLRREVESLLVSSERATHFIELPAFEATPELLTTVTLGGRVGKSIAHYRVESLLGTGGMAEVYLARDERLGRKVALKFLPAGLAANATQMSRLKTEARTASALNHPNILTVYEISTEGEQQFIATEYIEGITLRTLLQKGPIKLPDALDIVIQVGSALAAAHKAGVVHRDVKPENIMLRPDKLVKVLDFGIAKLTEQSFGMSSGNTATTTIVETVPGLILGTAHYMSPEQARGQKPDARSDIWSLGVVLYEMVGGIRPFPGATPSDCLAAILTKEPPPLSKFLPEVPLKLRSILRKALRKNRDERHQTVEDLLAELRALKQEIEVTSSGLQTKVSPRQTINKRKTARSNSKQALEASVSRLRDEMTRFQRVTKGWEIGVAVFLLICVGLVLWQLHGLPQLNAAMRQGVVEYPRAEVQVRAEQGSRSPSALEQEIYARLGEQLHVDPTVLREKLPQFAEVLKNAPDASAYEHASASYVAKDYREAERLAIEAAREVQRNRPTETKEIIAKLELAGVSAQRAVLYPRAMQHFVEAEKLTDPERDLKQWVILQQDIADLLVAWGKYAEAEKCLQVVIETQAAKLGAEHPDTLDTRHRLIYPLTRQTKYQQAETEARQVLALREKILGRENVDTLISIYNLADTLADQGTQEKYVEAEALYRKLIPLNEKLLGSEHPRTVACRLGLATVLGDLGKNVEAEPLYREVIRLDTKNFGPDDPTTLDDRANLAAALQAQGKFQEAEAEYRRVLNFQRKIRGDEHPNVLAIANNFAELLDDQAKFAEAEAECRRLITVEEKTLGPENRTTLNTRANLTVALIGQGKFSEAQTEGTDLLRTMERVLGLESADTQLFTEKLARAWFHQNRPVEAIAIARQAQDHARETLGDNHPVTRHYTSLTHELEGSN